jgi:hypothetical protein
MAEFAGKTRALCQSHGAEEALPWVRRSCRALELSFESVVLIGVVVSDDRVVTHEFNKIVNDLLEVKLIL